MIQYKVVIVMLLISQGVALLLLWQIVKRAGQWQAMWMRDSAELLFWKRHATLRDPKTGRYVKKVKRT